MPTVIMAIDAQYVLIVRDDDDAVCCSNCERRIGVQVPGPSGRVLLDVWGVRLWAAHGHCAGCGEEFHWTSSDQRLKRITGGAPKITNRGE